MSPNVMHQLTLFPEVGTSSRTDPKKESYEEFVGKFKPKLTTDDCYTPAPVYDAILDWVRKNCDIGGLQHRAAVLPGWGL